MGARLNVDSGGCHRGLLRVPTLVFRQAVLVSTAISLSFTLSDYASTLALAPCLLASFWLPCWTKPKQSPHRVSGCEDMQLGCQSPLLHACLHADLIRRRSWSRRLHTTQPQQALQYTALTCKATACGTHACSSRSAPAARQLLAALAQVQREHAPGARSSSSAQCVAHSQYARPLRPLARCLRPAPSPPADAPLRP